MMPYLRNQAFLYTWGNYKKKVNSDETNNENDDKIILSSSILLVVGTLGAFNSNGDLLYTFDRDIPTVDMVFEEDITIKLLDTGAATLTITGLYVGKNRSLTSNVNFVITADGKAIDIYGTVNFYAPAGVMGTNEIINLYGTINMYNDAIFLIAADIYKTINMTVNGDGTINAPAGFETQDITTLTVSPKLYTNLLYSTILEVATFSVKSAGLVHGDGSITVNKNIILQAPDSYIEIKNLMNSLTATTEEGKQTVNADNTITPIQINTRCYVSFTNP